MRARAGWTGSAALLFVTTMLASCSSDELAPDGVGGSGGNGASTGEAGASGDPGEAGADPGGGNGGGSAGESPGRGGDSGAGRGGTSNTSGASGLAGDSGAGGDAGQDAGGSGGKSGAAGQGGTGGMPAGGGGSGGKGGSGGSPGGSAGTNTGGSGSKALGATCSSPTGCQTPFECLQAPELPGGLCTQTCIGGFPCGPTGVCDVGNGLCLEACVPGVNANKCHGREDMACSLVDLVQMATTCQTDLNCPSGHVCLEGFCFELITGCSPLCGSDADCAGRSCDLGSGLCVATPPTGLPIGSPCDPDAATDACSGLCIGSSGGVGICSGRCRISTAGVNCGTPPTATTADAACLFVPSFALEADIGDSGFCAQLCDCSQDCLSPALGCIGFTSALGQPFTLLSRAGFCGTPATGDRVLDTCPP